ncbi:hypothetical protein C823_003039 [Eubacterium plexicaudatum ASF492]|nr:hypothetical protein C823_003039 [Eubacterium plexicaudatum ASF492]
MNKQGHGAEQRLVAETFQKSFAAMQDQKIVLYGTGINTEAVLQGTEGFRFVGLMDQAASGQVIYGQKVLNDREVIAMRPMIVIIARQSVVNIIFKRIQYLSLEHGICIYDLYGKLLGEENLQYQNGDLPYWNASEEELMEKIETSEIVSFDILTLCSCAERCIRKMCLSWSKRS